MFFPSMSFYSNIDIKHEMCPYFMLYKDLVRKMDTGSNGNLL